MPAPIDLRCQPHPRPLGPDIERATPLGSVDLVAAHRQQINAVALHIDGNLTHPLGGITVEQNLFFFSDCADLSNWVDRADLVVGVHDRDEDRLVGDSVAHGVGIDHPVAVHRQVGNRGFASPLQDFAGVQHRVVLGHAGDDVIALVLIELHHTLNGQIVALAAETVRHPRTHARIPHQDAAGVHLVHGRGMHHALRVERAHEANVVHALGQTRKERRDFHAALAVP